jgi:regulator of RNase E activity RraA
MTIWNNEEELYELSKKELFTALVGDVLDKMGYRHQFLPPAIKPVDPSMVVIGKAMTVLEADVYVDYLDKMDDVRARKPFGLMFKALDGLKKNEVYICSGASPAYALWGGLMSTRAIQCGAAGAVLNGYSRDTNEILRLKFPTFSFGGYAQDQGVRGKVIDYRIPIEINKVRIVPGDIIYGDRDGVVVVPKEAIKDAFEAAFEKARGEKQVLKALQNGMTSTDAFDTFGIM